MNGWSMPAWVGSWRQRTGWPRRSSCQLWFTFWIIVGRYFNWQRTCLIFKFSGERSSDWWLLWVSGAFGVGEWLNRRVTLVNRLNKCRGYSAGLTAKTRDWPPEYGACATAIWQLAKINKWRKLKRGSLQAFKSCKEPRFRYEMRLKPGYWANGSLPWQSVKVGASSSESWRLVTPRWPTGVTTPWCQWASKYWWSQ